MREHRRGDEHRRVGARDRADDQREGEVLQRVAAEQEQREHGQEVQNDVASERMMTSDIERLTIWENAALGMRGTFSRIRSNTMIVS